jgi:hypothetical protein
MTHLDQTSAHDIAFMRAMAEDGRSGGARMAGWTMVAAGVIFGGTSAALWAAIAGGLVHNGLIFFAAYAAAVAVFVAVRALLQRRLEAPRTVRTRTINGAWRAMGAAIWAIAISLALMGYLKGDWSVMGAMGPVVLALYGMAWMVSAVVSGEGWQRAVGLAAFAFAIAMGAVMLQPAWGGLVFSAAVFCLLAIPGMVLVRRATA